MPGTNTAAYLALSSVMKAKSFITWTPDADVLIFSPSSLMLWRNKLECLYLAITFQSNLTFAVNTRSLPKKEALQLGWLWPCPQILRPDWKGFPRMNPLAYCPHLLSVKKEKYITLTSGANVLISSPSSLKNRPQPFSFTVYLQLL